MFEFGKRYTVTFYEQDGRRSRQAVEKDLEVVSVEIPLVKFQRGGHEVVVNTTSPAFLKGVLQA